MIAEFFEKIPLTEIKNGLPRFKIAGDDPELLRKLRDFKPENLNDAEILDLFENPGGFFKTQITGPVTMLLNIRDSEDRNLFGFPQLIEWMKNYLIDQAKVRVRQIASRGWKPVFFLDEPSLAQLEPLFLESQKKFLSDIFHTFVLELKKEDAVVGIHCCGRTDWSLLMKSGFEIISFDAMKDMDHFLERKEIVQNYFESGNVVAWGLVPSEYLGYDLSCRELAESFIEKLRRLVRPALTMNFMLLHSLITTSCGTAGLSLQDNRKAHQWVREMSDILRKEMLSFK